MNETDYIKKNNSHPKTNPKQRIAVYGGYISTFIACIIGDSQLSAQVPTLNAIISIVYLVELIAKIKD